MAGYEKNGVKDPIFIKGLKLLHSEAEDSADQLKALLEEAIAQKYGSAKKMNVETETSSDEEDQMDIDVVKYPDYDSEESSVPNAESEETIEVVSREGTPPGEAEPPGEFAEESRFLTFHEESICAVCNGILIVDTNVLVECADCHLRFHQECHEPPVSDSDVVDPRLVWYCSNCSKKNMEKIHIKIKANPLDPSKTKCKVEIGSTTVDKNNAALFRRNEKATSSDSNKPSGGGMAHLAASIQCSKVATSGAASSSGKATLNYTKTPGSPNSKNTSTTAPVNIIAADKRIQNMKKKAAAKMHEKRVKLK